MRGPLIAAVATLCLAGSASAATPVSFTWRFGTQQVRTPTTATLKLQYGTPPEKPPGISRVKIETPAGTRFHLGLPFPCTATDAELTLKGPSACPDTSRLGRGTFTAYTGLLVDPLSGHLDLFRTPAGIVEVVRASATGPTIGTDRFRIDGATLSATPPALPVSFGLLSDSFLAPQFITSPPSCPTGGWRSTATIVFQTGETVVARATSPCVKPKRKKKR